MSHEHNNSRPLITVQRHCLAVSWGMLSNVSKPGWIPDGTGVLVLARLDDDGVWESLAPEWSIAGRGSSANEAIINALELLDDYLMLCVREGKSFDDSRRPVSLALGGLMTLVHGGGNQCLICLANGNGSEPLVSVHLGCLAELERTMQRTDEHALNCDIAMHRDEERLNVALDALTLIADYGHEIDDYVMPLARAQNIARAALDKIKGEEKV